MLDNKQILTNNLKMGKDKAKASFDAKSFTGLSLNQDKRVISLKHQDQHNFTIKVDGKFESFFGTLGFAISKLERLTNNQYTGIKDTRSENQDFINRLKSNKYLNTEPGEDCSSISDVDIKKLLTKYEEKS